MDDELLKRIREASGADGEDGDVPFDLVDAARGESVVDGSPDLTFRGYVERHDRPPAFEGIDGQPYTVAIDVEETHDPARPWVAFLVFVRWAATGAGIMGHVESGDVAVGESEDEARAGAEKLTLYDLKSELDAAIRRRREMES